MLPVGDKFGFSADSALGVEAKTFWAALLTWVHSFHADVEPLAREGVGVARVGLFSTVGVELSLAGAFETIGQNKCFVGAIASFAGGVFGPDANSFGGFEDQITGAGEDVLFSIDAREDQVASFLFGMVEETVSSWAVVDGLSRFLITKTFN